jgi:uncharacterized membrane protein YoaK (UPF0700 family)
LSRRGGSLKRYGPGARFFASCLTAVAGYVDAIGFLQTGGFFVSFMSGNSTRMAVGFVNGSSAAALGLSLIGAFVAGVTAGAILGRFVSGRRAMAILALVALLLAAAAVLLAAGAGLWGVLFLAFAMGAENTIFTQEGEVKVGLTYMTGALVKLGKGLAAALFGGERLGWTPDLILWLSLVAGAMLGGAVFTGIGVAALWGAAGAMAALAIVSPAVHLVERDNLAPQVQP